MSNKIGFKELSNWLKALVIFGYVALGLWSVLFLIGFIGELLVI